MECLTHSLVFVYVDLHYFENPTSIIIKAFANFKKGTKTKQYLWYGNILLVLLQEGIIVAGEGRKTASSWKNPTVLNKMHLAFSWRNLDKGRAHRVWLRSSLGGDLGSGCFTRTQNTCHENSENIYPFPHTRGINVTPWGHHCEWPPNTRERATEDASTDFEYSSAVRRPGTGFVSFKSHP